MADYNWSDSRKNQKQAGGTEVTQAQEISIGMPSEQLGEGRIDEDEYAMAAIEREVKQRKRRHFAVGAVIVVLIVVAIALIVASSRDAKPAKKSEDTSSEAEITELKLGNLKAESDGSRADEDYFSVYSTTDRLSRIYVGRTDDPSIRTDGEFIKECQTDYSNAVYPSNDWTVDEVIASYTENPDIWAVYHNKWKSDDHFICWTPDYQYCFEMDFDDRKGKVMTGWLYVNGVRVKLLDELTYDSVDPESMVARYLSHEWSGGVVRSSDGGTRVWINDEGQLDYQVNTEIYTAEQDLEGLAYTDYQDPWWFDEAASDEFEFIKDYDFSGEGGLSMSGYVEVYPDLPSYFDIAKIGLSEQVRHLGTLVVTTDGAMLFSRGEQLGSWVFDQSIPEEMFLAGETGRICSLRMSHAEANVSDVAYFYDGKRVLALENLEGQIRTVLDTVVVEDGESVYWAELIGLKGDALIVCDFGYDREYTMRTLETGVSDVDFVEMRTFEKADGLYALIYDENREITTTYLGTESKQYYLDYYQILTDARWGAFAAD